VPAARGPAGPPAREPFGRYLGGAEAPPSGISGEVSIGGSSGQTEEISLGAPGEVGLEGSPVTSPGLGSPWPSAVGVGSPWPSAVGVGSPVTSPVGHGVSVACAGEPSMPLLRPIAINATISASTNIVPSTSNHRIKKICLVSGGPGCSMPLTQASLGRMADPRLTTRRGDALGVVVHTRRIHRPPRSTPSGC
jgi:hypothetical protein